MYQDDDIELEPEECLHQSSASSCQLKSPSTIQSPCMFHSTTKTRPSNKTSHNPSLNTILTLPQLPEPVAKGIWRQVSYTTWAGPAEDEAESVEKQNDGQNHLMALYEMNRIIKKQVRTKAAKYQEMIRESAELRREDFEESDEDVNDPNGSGS